MKRLEMTIMWRLVPLFLLFSLSACDTISYLKERDRPLVIACGPDNCGRTP